MCAIRCVAVVSLAASMQLHAQAPTTLVITHATVSMAEPSCVRRWSLVQRIARDVAVIIHGHLMPEAQHFHESLSETCARRRLAGAASRRSFSFVSLRRAAGHLGDVGRERLRRELQTRLRVTMLNVIDAKPVDIQYSPWIAAEGGAGWRSSFHPAEPRRLRASLEWRWRL